MDILNIALNFDLEGDIVKINENSTGLINKTYIVITTCNKYIIQKINHLVFTNPELVMKNIKIVIQHLSKHKKECEMLGLINTISGNYYLVNNGDVYRCYNYLNDSIFYNSAVNDKQLYEMGKAIGEFHQNLLDLNPNKLEVTIPNFHDTDIRYRTLIESFKNCDTFKQQEVIELYNYINHEIQETVNINELLNSHQIKTRIVHNDTKLNNLVFSKKTGKAKCLIDLDTVMPGSILFDFGDALRSAGSTVTEECREFDKIDFSLNKCLYFIIGYLEMMSNYLDEKEVELMYDSIYMITIECGMRFLTDYLDGNKYFSINYEKQNLYRAINQLMLSKKIKNQKNLIRKSINNINNRIKSLN